MSELPAKKKRLSLDMTPEQGGELEELQVMSKRTTLIATVLLAVRLSKLFYDVKAAGGKVVLRDKDGQEETLALL